MAKLLEITGKAISGEWGQDDDTGTGIPVLRTTNFTNEGFVNYKNVVTRSISKKNIAEKYLRHGDVIIEKSGGSDKQPVGRVIFFEGEENNYLFNNFTGLLRVQNPEEWLPKYVFYALYAYYRNGGTRAFENRTTGLHNLQVDNYVKSVDIPKLSYRKQQHICETLDHVRDAVAYRERQLTKLDELIKARFVEMFENNTYPKVKVSTVCDFITKGTTPPNDLISEEYSSDKVPYLKVYNLSFNGELLFDTAPQYISENIHNGMLARSKVYPNDVLMNIVGPPLGKFSLVTDEFPEWNINQAIAIFRAKEKINPKYLLSALMQPEVLNPFLRQAVGIRQLNLSLSQCRDLEIFLPPLSLQNQFADFVAEVDKSKLLVGSAAAHKPFDIGFFSQKHCATPCKRGIISSKHMIFH